MGRLRGWDVAVVCMLRMWGDSTQFRVNVLFYFMVEWMRWKFAHGEGAVAVTCRISWGGVVLESACMVDEIRWYSGKGTGCVGW